MSLSIREELEIPIRPSIISEGESNERKEKCKAYLWEVYSEENRIATGEEAIEAGHRYAVRKFTIKKLREEAGIPIKHPLSKLSEEEKDDIIILANCRIPHRALAEDYNVKVFSIEEIMRKAIKEGKYVGINKDPFKGLANAINTYLTTEKDHIRKKIEDHVFSPIDEEIAKSFDSEGISDGYRRLFYSVFEDRRGLPELGEKEIINIVIAKRQEYIQNSSPRADSGYKKEMSKWIRDESLKELRQRYQYYLTPSQQTEIQEMLEELGRGGTFLRKHLGIGVHPRSLRKVGREFGLTGERVGWNEEKTLKELRDPSRSERLRSIYLRNDPRRIYDTINAIDTSIRSLETVLDPLRVLYPGETERYLESLKSESESFKRSLAEKSYKGS